MTTSYPFMQAHHEMLLRGCDRCGARARHTVTLKSGSELELCDYHLNEHDTLWPNVAASIKSVETNGIMRFVNYK